MMVRFEVRIFNRLWTFKCAFNATFGVVLRKRVRARPRVWWTVMCLRVLACALARARVCVADRDSTHPGRLVCTERDCAKVRPAFN